MNPQDPLANLQPLRDPALISWWPLAPGWWILIALLIVVLCGAGWLLYRRWQGNAYRRQALRQLHELKDADLNGHAHAAQINALLKSVAIQAYDSRQVASASGSDWRTFLNTSASSDTLFGAELDRALYAKDESQFDLQQLHRAATAWISSHKVTP
jgi:hypothetical protein